MTVTEDGSIILIVEDEEDVALVLEARLSSHGYDVHTETFGATALSYAVEHKPDLVILDVRLPDLGGYEVCEELRKLYDRKDVLVLMFTVMDGPVDDIHGFASGADAYLTKEAGSAELMKTVDQLLHTAN